MQEAIHPTISGSCYFNPKLTHKMLFNQNQWPIYFTDPKPGQFIIHPSSQPKHAVITFARNDDVSNILTLYSLRFYCPSSSNGKISTIPTATVEEKEFKNLNAMLEFYKTDFATPLETKNSLICNKAVAFLKKNIELGNPNSELIKYLKKYANIKPSEIIVHNGFILLVPQEIRQSTKKPLRIVKFLSGAVKKMESETFQPLTRQDIAFFGHDKLDEALQNLPSLFKLSVLAATRKTIKHETLPSDILPEFQFSLTPTSSQGGS